MRELIKSYEAFCDDPFRFDHTVTIYKEDDNYYQVKHTERQRSVDVESLPKTVTTPLKLFMGRSDPSLTEAPRPFPDGSFLKRPKLLLMGDYNETFARADENEIGKHPPPGQSMLAEAKIYEILKAHPPNICVYHGCVRDGDYFTDLCLKKYARSLEDAVLDEDDTLDIDKILGGVSKGLHFLHDTFGLVHGDINASNIMLYDEGNAVIVDFDSCLPIGAEIGRRKAGTTGWMKDENCTVALTENDWHGLTMLSKFMKEGVLP